MEKTTKNTIATIFAIVVVAAWLFCVGVVVKHKLDTTQQPAPIAYRK